MDRYQLAAMDPSDPVGDTLERFERMNRRELARYGACDACGEAPGKVRSRIVPPDDSDDAPFWASVCVECAGSPAASEAIADRRKSMRIAAVKKARRAQRERSAQLQDRGEALAGMHPGDPGRALAARLARVPR